MNRPQSPLPYLYPATPTPEPEGGATVVFRDLPEAITCGANDEEVRAMAGEVLELAVAERMDRGEEVPAASTAKPGDILIRLRPLLAAKAALHNALKHSQTTKSDLARRLQVDEAVVRRMLQPRRATRIDNLAAALEALGVTLQVTVGTERRMASHNRRHRPIISRSARPTPAWAANSDHRATAASTSSAHCRTWSLPRPNTWPMRRALTGDGGQGS